MTRSSMDNNTNEDERLNVGRAALGKRSNRNGEFMDRPACDFEKKQEELLPINS